MPILLHQRKRRPLLVAVQARCDVESLQISECTSSISGMTLLPWLDFPSAGGMFEENWHTLRDEELQNVASCTKGFQASKDGGTEV